jgi:hypothetical protein
MCVPFKSKSIYKNIVYNRNKGKLKERAGGDIRLFTIRESVNDP